MGVVELNMMEWLDLGSLGTYMQEIRIVSKTACSGDAMETRGVYGWMSPVNWGEKNATASQ